jgi:hypothetical protein
MMSTRGMDLTETPIKLLDVSVKRETHFDFLDTRDRAGVIIVRFTFWVLGFSCILNGAKTAVDGTPLGDRADQIEDRSGS